MKAPWNRQTLPDGTVIIRTGKIKIFNILYHLIFKLQCQQLIMSVVFTPKFQLRICLGSSNITFSERSAPGDFSELSLSFFRLSKVNQDPNHSYKYWFLNIKNDKNVTNRDFPTCGIWFVVFQNPTSWGGIFEKNQVLRGVFRQKNTTNSTMVRGIFEGRVVIFANFRHICSIHSDALADINKVRKISKYGHFRPKWPFFTPKKGQKSPKSQFAQKSPPVASKSTKNGSFWRILRGLDLADNRGTSQCKRQKWSFFVIFDDFCDFSLLSDPF